MRYDDFELADGQYALAAEEDQPAGTLHVWTQDTSTDDGSPTAPRLRAAIHAARAALQGDADAPQEPRYPFDPDWVVAPGETLREWRETSHLPVKAAATACARMPVALYEGVEAGTEPITENVAKGLEWGTHIPASLWLNLERAFRAGLEAGKTWTR